MGQRPDVQRTIKIVDENPEKAEAFLTPWLMSHGKEEYIISVRITVSLPPGQKCKNAANNDTLR